MGVKITDPFDDFHMTREEIQGRRVRAAYFTLDENLYTLKQEAAMQDVTVYERGDIERILNDFLEKKSTLASTL